MKHYHCPANDYTCPYYSDLGHPCRCTLTDPYADCDDFGFFWGDEVEPDEFTDHDWDPCLTCSHNGDETLEDVSCCACCEVGDFYHPDKKMIKLINGG